MTDTPVKKRQLRVPDLKLIFDAYQFIGHAHCIINPIEDGTYKQHKAYKNNFNRRYVKMMDRLADWIQENSE
jgi:hypothetical protein